MNTPTTLELEPGNHIQVTLFDANHCPGAVMFCQLALAPVQSLLLPADLRSI